jgi:Zn-dependent protease
MSLVNYIHLIKSIIFAYRLIWLISITLIFSSLWIQNIFIFSIISTFGLFSAIFIHEIAHLLLAYYFHSPKLIKIQYQQNHLNISYPFHPIPSIIISLAGPLSNIIIAIIASILTQDIFNIIVIINIIFGIGNLFPPSNDGKEIFKGLKILIRDTISN